MNNDDDDDNNNNNKIKTLDDAVTYYQDKIAPGSKIVRACITDPGRPPFAYWMDNHDAVMLKKEWFYKFKTFYNLQDGGIGQTFNMKLVEEAAHYHQDQQEETLLVFVMKDAKAYSVDPMQALMFITKYNTKRILPGETGEEGSIPARMCNRIEVE